MAHMRSWIGATLSRQSLVHSARTAVAAVASLVVARALRLPEAYWAAISTLIIMQSTLGAALTISRQRFIGTALGAIAAALVTTWLRPGAVTFGVVVLGIGLLSSALRLDRAAYRFATITLAIVMLIPRAKPGWVVATHRFIEVSVGIGVGLLLTAVWPEDS